MESQFKRCLSVLFRILGPLICCPLVTPLENSEVEVLYAVKINFFVFNISDAFWKSVVQITIY